MLAGASAAGLLMVYLMVFKKWRLSDFLYVTRRSLKQGLDQVNKGGRAACWHGGKVFVVLSLATWGYRSCSRQVGSLALLMW